jgi:hypothetical protein
MKRKTTRGTISQRISHGSEGPAQKESASRDACEQGKIPLKAQKEKELL